MTANPWTFTQLGGSRRTLTLAGWSAPFGRPRQRAVVRDKVRIRQRTTRYPGSDGPPTRHVFGDDYDAWELHGRFMDREGGPGYAATKTKEVADFVRDKQEVRIDWGDLVSVNGFLESFDPGRESPGEVEWKMVVLIDEDNLAAVQRSSPAAPSPKTRVQNIEDALAPVDGLAKLRPSILDALSNAVSSVNAALAVPATVVAQLASLEQATMGELQRLRGGLGQVRTAILSMRDLVFSTRNDSILLARSFTADAQAGSLLAKVDVSTMAALAETARLDRDAEIIERGKFGSTTVAKAGDTWESLSVRAYGTPDRADSIRQANGAQYGEQPAAGQRYLMPAAT